MAQYIDKDALVAEIKRRKEEEVNHDENGWYASWADYNHFSTLDSIQNFISTLEVKEDDLDEVKIGETQIYIEDDGGEPPYDGKQWLDLGCLEYEIPTDKFKDGDNVELIIRKVQKGE